MGSSWRYSRQDERDRGEDQQLKHGVGIRDGGRNDVGEDGDDARMQIAVHESVGMDVASGAWQHNSIDHHCETMACLLAWPVREAARPRARVCVSKSEAGQRLRAPSVQRSEGRDS